MSNTENGDCFSVVQGATVSPVVWPLVKLGAAKMREGDAMSYGATAEACHQMGLHLISSVVDATPTDAREVGAVLVALKGLIDDMADIAAERTPGIKSQEDREEAADNVADKVNELLQLSAAVLWGRQGWDEDMASAIELFSSVRSREGLHRRLSSVGVPGFPAHLLTPANIERVEGGEQ